MSKTNGILAVSSAVSGSEWLIARTQANGILGNTIVEMPIDGIDTLVNIEERN